MTRRPLLAVLALAALAAAPAGRPSPEAVSEPLPVPLETLRADPTAGLGREVRFVLQIDRRLAGWNPYHTRFGPGDFAGYRAWADERFLWERAVFDDPTARLFARRGSAAERALSAGRPYERFEVRAFVRDAFLGEPWIEILAATRLAEHVSEGAILHAARGIELALDGNAVLARGQLERARAGLLPAHAEAELDRLLAELDG